MAEQSTGNESYQQGVGIPIVGDASIPVEVVVDVVKNLCLAYSTIHLYSYEHPITESQIKQAWDHLAEVFAGHGSITLSMADGKLFFEGVPLEEKNPTVARLSEHFEQLQVTSLSFLANLDEKEFHRFFQIFAREPAEIRDAGGLDATFKEQEIRNIRLNSAVYRLIHEDEKVVSSDSMIVDRGGSGGRRKLRQNQDVSDGIVHYFVDELLKQTRDSSGLINAMKNDPISLAEKVSRLLLSADSDLEKVEFEEIMKALREEIDATAQIIALAEEGTDDPAEVGKLDNALHSMQGEMQRRSKRIASTGATKFLRRMTDLIAAYSDSARAESAMRDFVEEEHSHKAAQKMLSEISPDAEASRQLLVTIQDTMVRCGWDPLQLARQIERLAQADARQPGRAGGATDRMSRLRRRRLAASMRRMPRPALLALLMRGRHRDDQHGGAMAQQRLHEVEQELHDKERQLDEQQQQLTKTNAAAEALQLQATDLEKQVNKLRNDRTRLGAEYRELQQKESQAESDLEEEQGAAKNRLADIQKEFEERLDDEVRTAMGMLEESEDVRLRLESLVEKLDTGVVILDREGRVVTSMNAQGLAYLQTAAIPPSDLVRALRSFAGDTILTYDNIQIFGVVRDAEGYLSGFMFLPEHEMSDDDNRPRLSAADVLAELVENTEEEGSLDELLASRETPSTILRRVERDNTATSDSPGMMESPSREQQESLARLLARRELPGSRVSADKPAATASEPDSDSEAQEATLAAEKANRRILKKRSP